MNGKKITPPEFYTGAPVDHTDLRYREEFLALLWETLARQHVLLTAPRRTGKTSVMDHLLHHPKGGFLVLKENVQDLNHPADFFLALLARFHDEHPNLVRDAISKGWSLVKTALDKIESVGTSEFKVALRESDPKWSENWRRHGDELLKKLREPGKPVLIVIDELPDMLLNMRRDHPEALQPFLAWFRSQRLEPNPKSDPLRWLVGGSVNLSSTLDAVGMVDLINDLEDLGLPVLTEAQVKDFVTTMLESRGVPLRPEVASAVNKVLGRPIPLFLQMLTQDLFREWKKVGKRERPMNKADVAAAFERLVRSSAAQDRLQHYHSRLREYYREPALSAAHAILGKLSLSANGISRRGLNAEFEHHLSQAGQSLLPHESKQAFNQLLRDLANDFYIEEITEDQFDFASGILKSWWRKYYA